MTIGSVNNLGKIYQAKESESAKPKSGDAAKAAKAGETSRQTAPDTLVLSAEAKKLRPIKDKIAEGFYDRPEVVKKAAAKILQELPKSGATS